MSKSLLLFSLLFSLFSFSQTIIFEDSFENYPDFTVTNFGDWVMYDVDQVATWEVSECNFPHEGEPMSAIIFNPSQCTDDQQGTFVYTACNYSTLPDGGDKYITFWCAGGSDNDNYVISPQIDLSNYEDATLNLFAKQLADVGGGFDPEHFEILVSTSGNTIASFTDTIGDTVLPDNCIWYEYNYDLSAFAGQQIYIAIHHITTLNGYALHIDNFKVEGTNYASIDNLTNFKFNYFPNPVVNELNIQSDIEINSIKIVSILGQTVISNKYSSKKDININLSNLDNGVYLVFITNYKNQTENFKFIKQ